VAYLKGRKEINAKQIGLLGHSEGGIVAPLAASQSDDVAFIVLLAGTGLVGEEILYLQGKLISKAAGGDEKAAAMTRRLQEIVFRAVKEEKDPKAVEKRFREAWDKEVAKLNDEEKKAADKVAKVLPAQLKMVTTPWFRYFMTYDPLPALRKVRCPVLALNGEKDLQVPPKENLTSIEKALKEGGNKDVTLKEFPNLNHLFQTCKTGSPTEYGTIEETIAPAVLQTIAEWILARTTRKGK
jgi:hypothetical protein